MEALRQVFYEIDNSNQKSVNFEAGAGVSFFIFFGQNDHQFDDWSGLHFFRFSTEIEMATFFGRI